MRFSAEDPARVHVVATTRAVGTGVMLIGGAPLVWAVFAGFAYGAEFASVAWFVGALALFITIAGLAMVVHKVVLTFKPAGIDHVNRKLWGTQRRFVPRHHVRLFTLTRVERKTTVTPWGVTPGSVHYEVACRSSDGSFDVFSTWSEEQAHVAAVTMARILGAWVRDEIGDESVSFDPAAGFRRAAPDDGGDPFEFSVEHPPPAIGVDPVAGDLASGTNALRWCGVTPRRRRAAACLEFVLFGAVTAFFCCLIPTASTQWWTLILLVVAIGLSGFPFVRVIARGFVVERLWRDADALVVERSLVGFVFDRRTLPLDELLAARVQTRPAVQAGLVLLTTQARVRVGSSLRAAELGWLQRWIDVQVEGTANQAVAHSPGMHATQL